MTLGKYLKCKDSGVEWIGEIPAEWKTKKLKEISDIRMSNIDKKSIENEPDVLLCNYIDVYNNDFISAKLEFMKATASEEQIKRLSLHKGDVLITKDSEEPTDIAIPAFVAEEIGGLVCGYHLALITPDQRYVLGEYLFRSLQCSRINEQFVIQANGVTRFAIGTYAILNSKIFVPPLPEQKLIISYLDTETSKLQQLIDFKHHQIELLHEHEKSLIHQTVTKGLDPNTKMKDSGVEWIGGIPEEWGAKSISKEYDVQLGKMLQPNETTGSELKPYLRTANVLWNMFDLADVKEMYILPSETDMYSISKGDLLLCEGGDIGRAAIWNGALEECYIQNSLHRIRPKTNASNKYLYYCLVAANALGEVERVCNKATIAHYTLVKVRRTKMPFPPQKVQEKIATFLDSETAKIHQAINNIENQIIKLEEYCKSLIYEVVTGKVKVS